MSSKNKSYLLKDRNATELNLESWKVSPIGYLFNDRASKFDAPPQPSGCNRERSIIKLTADISFEHALTDLDTFSHIWLVWWFHRAKTWKPKVLPPRGPKQKRGLFATRSPHRFNPIGLTAVKLISINKNIIEIGSNDLIDGTPILDIKPYLPKNDCVPDANGGWVDDLELDSSSANFQVLLSELAQQQLNWFSENKINFFTRASELLAIDPTPHRTRRIVKLADQSYRMGCAGWRIHFLVDNKIVQITHFSSGYPKENLSPDRQDKISNYAEQVMFQQLWL